MLDSIISGGGLMSFDHGVQRRHDCVGGSHWWNIDARKGHKCIECGHCTPVWGSDHFVKEHNRLDAKNRTEHGIEMRAPFGGGLKKWFEIIDCSTVEIDEGNESPWMTVKVLMAKNRQRGCTSTERRRICGSSPDFLRVRDEIF